MNPVNFIPSLIALGIAISTIKIITKFSKFNLTQVKFVSIDGLRGYLAFFVFLHHSSIWYFYLRTNKWTIPPSNLYTHFGQTSVAIFFMITGFLFFSKLNNKESKLNNWFRFFIGRTMRLAPLYLFAVAILIIIVGILSGFSLYQPISTLFKEFLLWITFTILGAPDINSVYNTSYIMAGVTWSLSYEWLFYLSLPLIGFIFFRIKTSTLTLLITSIVLAMIIYLNNLLLIHIISFSGGIIASYLIKLNRFCLWASQKLSSVIVLLCLTLAITIFPTAYNFTSLLLITIAFILIACGNTIFGLLGWQSSRMLGQMAYSIYILHGIILFLTFKFIVKDASQISAMEHWLIIFCCVVPLIIICYLTHLYIELPFIKATSRISTLLTKYYKTAKLNLLPSGQTQIKD